MDYAHVITLAAPEGLWDQANALALVIGEQPGDAQTFTAAEAQDEDGDGYSFVHARVSGRAFEILSGTRAPDAPDHSPDADLTAAGAALALISAAGPATPDAISIRVDHSLDDALLSMGLTPTAEERVAPPQSAERAEQLGELIKVERDRRLSADFTFRGVRYQRDPISVQRIAMAAQLAALAIMAGAQPGDYFWTGRDEAFGWIASDDSVTEMDAHTVIDFGRAAAERESMLIFAARYLRSLNPVPEDYTDDRWWPE